LTRNLTVIEGRILKIHDGILCGREIDEQLTGLGWFRLTPEATWTRLRGSRGPGVRQFAPSGTPSRAIMWQWRVPLPSLMSTTFRGDSVKGRAAVH